MAALGRVIGELLADHAVDLIPARWKEEIEFSEEHRGGLTDWLIDCLGD